MNYFIPLKTQVLKIVNWWFSGRDQESTNCHVNILSYSSFYMRFRNQL